MLMVRLLTCVVCFVGWAAAADFCAVRLEVSDEEGRPLDVRVELTDPSGKTVAHTHSWQGEAEFCDFGFGEHSILVGGDTCNSVLIRKVRLTYHHPQTFKVGLTMCPSKHFMGTACGVYFRVTDEGGEPAVAVAVHVEGVLQSRTDRYGRALTLIRLGRTETVTFSYEPYETKAIEVNCRGPIEKLVVLKRKK